MFRIGDKVCIPKTKSVGVPITKCEISRQAEADKLDYLCIVSMRGASRYVVNTLDAFKRRVAYGNHYLKQDLELYIPEEHYIGGIKDV